MLIQSSFTWRNVYLLVASAWTISGISDFIKLYAYSYEDLLKTLKQYSLDLVDMVHWKWPASSVGRDYLMVVILF